MNAELLLAHFNRISAAPDSVPRLRKFILDLAVRGKLVEQNSTDEPASRMFARITAEHRRLKGSVAPKECAEIVRPYETPFTVPKNWYWVRLGERLELYNGRAFKPSDWISAGLPIVRIQNLNNEAAPFNYCAEVDVQPRHIINSGSFLISWSGTPGTSFGAFIWHRGNAALNQHIFSCFQRGETFYDRFLQLAINGRLDEMIAKAHGGVGLQHITKGKLEFLPLPLPPLAEQHRIIVKVDELMALCDGLEAVQREQETRRDQLTASTHHHLNNGGDADELRNHAQFFIGNLPRLTTRADQIKQLRQTILNLALRGKIVLQDSKEESAAQLSKRIQAEKQRLLRKGSIRSILPERPIESAETLLAIPSSWRWVRLADLLLGDSQNGHSKKPDDAPDGTPILRISAGTVRSDGIVAEEEHKLLGGVSSADQMRYELQAGDLLACRFNGNTRFVGRITLYEGYLGLKLIYPDKLIRMRVLPGFVVPKLVRYFAESSIVRKDIESYCATTVGNWGISASNLKEVKLPLPPFAEQHRIVAKVDELMALCNQLEASLATARTEASRLLESVLHHALQDASLA